MLNESITPYKNVKLRQPELLHHSRLYSIEPIGIGTSKVESLSGYVARLALMHCVSPSALCVGEIMPLIYPEKFPQRKTWRISYNNYLRANFSMSAHFMNSMGDLTINWIESLGSLTSQRNLHCLTALTWRNIISSQSWLRRKRAWCPICYQEQFDTGKIVYEQLLWTINAVAVCSRHRSHLSTTCPYCHKSQPVINARSRPGHCCLCNNWLGTQYREPSKLKSMKKDFEKLLQIEQAIGDLLAFSTEINPIPQRTGITESMNKTIVHFTEGNRAAFARDFGISYHIVNHLLKGGRFPTIETVLKLCFSTDNTPLNFLLGNVNYTSSENTLENKIDEAIINNRQSSRSIQYEYRKRVLNESLNEWPPPSPARMAKRLNFKHPSAMYPTHSAICQKIRARYKSFKQQQPKQTKIKKHVDLATARQICELALVENPPPFITDVAARMGYSNKYPHSVRRFCPDLYELLVDRRAEYDGSITDSILKELHNGLQAKSPPYLKTIAKHCRVNPGKIKRLFPELCRELEEYHKQLKNRQSEERRCILKAALNENPMPTKSEMAKRIGYDNEWMLNLFFPDIAREHLVRVKEAKLQKSKETRLFLEQVLMEIPPPSLDSVSRRLGVSTGTLYKRCATTCYKISARYTVYISKLAAIRKEQFCTQVRRIFLELHSKGINPTTNCIAKYLTQPALVRHETFKELYQALRSEIDL